MKWLSLCCHLKVERDRSSGDGVEGRRRTKTSRKWTEQQPGAYFGHWSWIWLLLSSLYLAMLESVYPSRENIVYFHLFCIWSHPLWAKISIVASTLGDFHQNALHKKSGDTQGVLAEQVGGRMSCSLSCHVVSVTQEPVEMSWSQMFCRLCSGCFSSVPRNKEQGSLSVLLRMQQITEALTWKKKINIIIVKQTTTKKKKHIKVNMHIVMWCRPCRFIDQFFK